MKNSRIIIIAIFVGIFQSSHAVNLPNDNDLDNKGSTNRNTIVGSGTVAEEIRNVVPFSTISCFPAISQCLITANADQHGFLKLSGDANLLKYIETTVFDNVLQLSLIHI